jgi:basic membrane lipoprotein Med (substrate-binding protein (PBP1-ABC) superfamily)
MLERNFKLILLELQIILEKARNKSFSEKNKEEIRNWTERIEEALNRIKKVYGIERENLNIFSNKLTKRVIDDIAHEGAENKRS